MSECDNRISSLVSAGYGGAMSAVAICCFSCYWGDLLSPDMGKNPFHGSLVDVDTEPTPVATVNY